MVNNIRYFNVHGDNIVECERFFDLIQSAFSDYSVEDHTSTAVQPCFHLISDKESLSFTYFPGYGRWNQDVRELVLGGCGALREGADIILTEVIEDEENPIIAIEYCSALAAGNNSWQRSGRALSFAAAEIPYVYLTEVGGYELDNNRKSKNRRYPNIQVPLSYLLHTNITGNFCLPVYGYSPSAEAEFREVFSQVYGVNELAQMIKGLINNHDVSDHVNNLKKKVANLIHLIDKDSSDRPGNWKETIVNIDSYQDIDSLFETSWGWNKKVTIDCSNSFKTALELTKKYAVSLTKSSVPIAYIPQSNVAEYVNKMEGIYGFKFNLSDINSKPLITCWIAGFKPRGDDSRPDRGVLPLARMLYGEDANIVSWVYGPGKDEAWAMFENKPKELMAKNGLWEAVLGLSDSVVVDSLTRAAGPLYLHNESWCDYEHNKKGFTKINGLPTHYGENDVDSVIHYIISHVLGGNCFEGMCNPPGGDWSGISILSEDKEVRWCNLPRVSGPKTKRPDHVVQFQDDNVVLSIESKETIRTLEKGIGPRLKKYLRSLFSYQPSAWRQLGRQDWNHDKIKVDAGFTLISVGAFMGTDGADEAFGNGYECDMIIEISFDKKGKSYITAAGNTKEASSLLLKMEREISRYSKLIEFTINN